MNSGKNVSSEIKIRVGDLIKEGEAFLRFKIFENAEVEVNDIKELFSKGKELMGDKSYCLITDARTHITATKEAREYAANKLKANNIIANAVLTNSIPVALLTNFYIRINRPEVPTQMFKTESKAFDWLDSILKERVKV